AGIGEGVEEPARAVPGGRVNVSDASRQETGSRRGLAAPSGTIRGRPSVTGAAAAEADEAIGTPPTGPSPLRATISPAGAPGGTQPRDNTRLPIQILLMSPLSLPKKPRGAGFPPAFPW